MTFWFIVGGAVVASWALLSVMGGELTRRKRDLVRRYPQSREPKIMLE